ncbi:putative Methylmalonyl-CoA mutase large subunit [Pseudomonas coronafaciens pv. oryzae]|uniref:methylmalonyl-CoA mutase n=1 Tax=Pseudomonas coronafaciens TaxID=53409 RepID=UPI0006B59D4F|nr:methylmalonyl-CoA mutase [Pseudomonas coronafaciens]KPB49634.1 putative Methylmalonyl-CoA mutase large subunit [Pseudomonas coronafaciens pv. oryzae]KPY04457.1 putative Methylmalonyl-CoA mutase large subunit [Pseudomonas coronafaciens pv. oryzae]RMS98151.1 putative Methylmalonyl-CoA mutase large subunit [Pseudomonas coronafaciens pv. oryzae]
MSNDSKASDSKFFEQWSAAARKYISEQELAGSVKERYDGLKVKPLYTYLDVTEIPHLKSFPGFAPFLRGVIPTMYASKPWTIRQYAGFSTASESNEFFKAALKGGQQGISVAFDLATHRGYDSDNPRVAGDVGKAGVAIDTVEDMKALFNGIDLKSISVSMTMNGAVLPILASFIVAAQEQGLSLSEISGTIQNDILKEFLVRNTYIYPPEHSMRIVRDILSYTSTHMPKFNSISISGYHMHEAGASVAMELALTMADGIEYLELCKNQNIDIDLLGCRISFFFAAGMDFYLEIAKLRAARVLWYEIMGEFGARTDKARAMRVHTQTSGVSLTVQDPLNNIVRTTIEAMSAVFGGTQSLHTNSFDEAIGLPTDESSRIARNTQLIIQEETGISDVIDPWAGSYLIETLTQELINKAKIIISEVKSQGGMTAAVANGWARAEIDKCAAQKQADIDAGKITIVGVNKYQTKSDSQIPYREVSSGLVLATQIDSLARVKLRRNTSAVKQALLCLKYAAQTADANILSLTIDAIRARATVGEVSETLVSIFGRHEASTTLAEGIYNLSYAQDKNWQNIKKKIIFFKSQHNRPPHILMTKLGQDGHDRGMRVLSAAFRDLGFSVTVTPLFKTPEEVARISKVEKVDAIGVSSLAGGHKHLIKDLFENLNFFKTQPIVFLGGIIPDADHNELLSMGVGGIYTPGVTVAVCASDILEKIQNRTIAIKPRFRSN